MRASTIAETPTPGTLCMPTICARGWRRGERTLTRPPGESTTRCHRDAAELASPAARSQRSSSGASSPTTSLSTPTLESSGRRATTRSSTSESDGSGAGGSSRMFEMFLENNGGFIEPTKPSQTGSTGGAPRWLLEAVRPQVHLEYTDGQHDQDRGDSVDGEALDSVDDEEVRDELIPPLLRFQCHCCRRSILWMTRRNRTTSPSAVVCAISMTRNRRASCTSAPIFAIDSCSLSNALLLPSPQC
jgi:hypothetical protein